MRLAFFNRLGRFWNDRDTPPRQARVKRLRERLAERLGAGARLVVDESHRRIFSRDLAEIPRFLEHALFRTTPLLVVQPRNTREIADVLHFANEEGIAVFPRGVASSAFGGPVPTANGIVLDLSPLTKIDPPRPKPAPSQDGANGGTVTVDAGARWDDIDKFLEPFGLQLFTYPSNKMATVAGWLASGGYGINGFKYGHVARHVDALEIVTPTGEIKSVNARDKDFGNYFATEGLMAVIARVTLRVRSIPKHAMPHLIYFANDADALRFVDALIGQGITPATVKFHDAHSLELLNEHNTREDKHVRFEPEPALLVFADDVETEERLTRLIHEASQAPDLPMTEAPKHIAGSLWADRFFPMKIRTLGPSLLAAQVVLPPHRVAAFLGAARQLGRTLGLTPATEAHVISTPRGVRVLAMPMFLTDGRKFAYSLHLAFVSLLDRIGARFEGQPYNLGIWHAPFVAERYDRKMLAELRAFKRKQDPKDILNPNKFFRVHSRFAGIPGLLFYPPIFKLAMDAFQLVLRAGLFKFAARPMEHQGRPVYHDIKTPQVTFQVPAEYTLQALAGTALECTSCGMCVSICPAYIHTRDERVTGRAKLWLASRLANGEEVAQSEADAAWECVRCRACAEVCQAQLPLMLAWEKLEQELRPRFGRPDALLHDFIGGLERDPTYRASVGLTLPVQLLEQRWHKTENGKQTTDGRRQTGNESPRGTAALPAPAIEDEAFAWPVDGPKALAAKYHIAAKSAPARFTLHNKVSILRSEQCISCGQCIEACVYGVHDRNPLDVRRMNVPNDFLCRACFRCIQECPRQALTMTPNEAYARLGRAPYSPDVVSWLLRQSEEGQIPVLGAGYRGPFSAPGFDAMWTDMSEIVRPTRDGIHGREYISTTVVLGRRPLQLSFAEDALALPPAVEIPLPIVFADLPFHRAKNVLLAELRAAAQLGTFAVVRRAEWDRAFAPFAHNIILHIADAREVEESLAHFRLIRVDDPALIAPVKAVAQGAVVITRTGWDAAHTEELARQGAEVIHLDGRWDGAELVEELPRIHSRLLEAGLRDQVTLIASGGIAMAEHVPKAIILGADAVAIDLPLLVALECLLQDECFAGDRCPRGVEDVDPVWGAQRIVNLEAAWRNQLLEVLGAMGLREVSRLRGERGRALFKQDLDQKLLVPVLAGMES
jgi:FAD/FMN-containing dehydrogenase/ferredoxin